VGAAAICGLPPLNGFASELLIFLGLFRSWTSGEGGAWGLASLAVPALALIGALALACFVKAFGTVFLGSPRTEAAAAAREGSKAMTLPMGILAAACVGIGLAPSAAAPLLDAVSRAWAPGSTGSLAAAAPLTTVSYAGAGTLVLAALAAALGFRRLAPKGSARGAALAPSDLGTWDCGYARPSPSMQYTASSFSQTLVGLFGWALLPRTRRARVEGPFPARTSFHSEVPDAVLDRLILPVFAALAWGCSWFRLLQRGKINAYLFYIFITLLILLLAR